MIRRIIEISLGSIVLFCLIANYSGNTNESQLLIWYILTPKVLKIIVWILLFLAAGRLIFGKYKDHSKYYYNLLVHIFGNPKKERKSD